MKDEGMLFGIRAVAEALQSGREIDRLLVRKDLQGDSVRELFGLLKARGIRCQRVPAEGLNRITRKNHQGVIAYVSAVTYHRLEDVVPAVFEQGKDPFLVLLDGITDVRNFGAIARTCECAGVDALVIPSKESVTVNADAMKTSAGALNLLPVCKEHSIRGAIRFLRDSGVKVVAADEKAVRNYTEMTCNLPVAIVMGAEDRGVAAENLRLCDEAVKIPHYGTIASLNVSVAAAILTYEVVRQRKLNGSTAEDATASPFGANG
ncbi:MAG: 23S rRNA (guanosine(2251)-2'-O)-methyltransferase RlmB [Tannerella sp.]|jgi:23S rRNA (guanosine2251-2'-O)-methyltransferase|nr:23S rRNA (guanosine(2251)-2'-O)-methyltransferase RlmB [Tannerella sp.]